MSRAEGSTDAGFDASTVRQIADSIAAVRARIDAACERVGRDASVTLIGVTKTHPIDVVRAAVAAGLRDLGENRVQEALPKIEAIEGGVTWHLIGHLQTNKVRVAIDSFDILHVVDSDRLAQAISERATKPVRVLIEVNVAEESSKYGFPPGEAIAAAERVGRLPHIDLAGLMTDLRITRENARFQQWEALLTNRSKRHRNREFLVQGVRPPLPAEALHARGDGSAGNQHHFAAHPSQLGDLPGPARERIVVEPPALVGDQARANLDDDAFRLFQYG